MRPLQKFYPITKECIERVYHKNKAVRAKGSVRVAHDTGSNHLDDQGGEWQQGKGASRRSEADPENSNDCGQSHG